MQLLAPLSKLMTGSPHDDPPAGVSDNLFRGHRNSQNGWQDRACCRLSLLQTQPVVTVAEEAVVSTNGRRPSCMPVTGQGLGSGSIATVAMATDRCSETRCSISVGQAVLSVCCHQSNDPGQWRHWRPGVWVGASSICLVILVVAHWVGLTYAKLGKDEQGTLRHSHRA